MSKKSNDKTLTLEELYDRGWTDSLIKSMLPEQLPNNGGWYETTIRCIEETIFAKKKNIAKGMKRERYNKTQEKKLGNIIQSITISNPALDYPLAREIRRHFIINVGETNTGKTYTALQALKTVSDGIYLSPLRLLAMEVQDTLLEDGCICSMTTGEEENIIPFSTVMSSTVEKLDINHRYELGVIDECQMIMDTARGGAWTRAILGMQADEIYLCMSQDALKICTTLINMCGDTYEVHECKRMTPLTYQNRPVNVENLEKGDAIIVYSRREVLRYAQALESLGRKVSVIYGALPYEARKHQVELYKKGETDIVVSTDAIGMGLNLPIKRVLFAEDSKFDGIMRRQLNSQEVKQVAGRAGRRGIFEEGFVSTFGEAEVNHNYIRSKLHEPPKNIEKAILPFPEECVNDKMKISETMKLWKRIKYPQMFITEDLDERIKKIEYLEKSTYYEFDKQTMLLLSKVIFDEKDDVLYDTYREYIHKYYNNEYIWSPFFSGNADLKRLELNYKELQLYYSFHKTLGLEIDLVELAKNKANLVRRINKELAKEKSETKPKKCRYCNKELPPFFKFNICEDCYQESRYGWQNYYNNNYSDKDEWQEDLPF